MLNRYIKYTIFLSILILSILFTDCGRVRELDMKMDLAENLMETKPDSALNVLEEIDMAKLKEGDRRARYSLLKSIALDKNYIDTTSFDVIQPAVDYYLNSGQPTEKCQTLYYQGRIYQNIGDDESAMKCFLLANDLKSEVKDSLLLARNMVALGTLYIKQYKIREFINVNKEAANIYHKVGKPILEIRSYTNVLNGFVLEKNRAEADSVLNTLFQLVKRFPEGGELLFSSLLSYKINFGSDKEIKLFLDQYPSDILNQEDALDMASGYSKIGECEKALGIISEISLNGNILDSLKYAAVKTNILEERGDYEQTLTAFKEYYALLSRHHQNLLFHDLLFAEQKHQLEMKNLKELQDRNRMIWIIVCGAIFLLILVILLLYVYRLSCSKRLLIEKENENLKLVSDNLNKEKKNIELERDKKTLEANNLKKEKALLIAQQRQRELEAENLLFEKKQLEEERDNLKELLKEQKEMAQPVQKIIVSRLDILNSLLAKEISNNNDYARPYNKWIESIRTDKVEFMNSTRLAFTASHPKFINFLVENGLTDDEINYICLYAIGLRGKEVGEYIKLKRHYNVSSEIRKKLGLDEHETNLGPYIRKKLKEFAN